MRVLVAGFGPFPGAPFNPSAALAKALARTRRPALAGIDIAAHAFATTYASVDRDLKTLLARKPDIVLIFGMAGRRRQVCVETRAQNAASLLFPDAGGQKPAHGVIELHAPAALKGNAPFAPLVHALKESGVPARRSRDAGRYLCNYAYWRALRQTRGGHPLVQFVHIPSLGFKPRPRRRSRKLTLPRLVRAAEALLIALAAANRR